MATSSILKQVTVINDRSAKIIADLFEHGEPMVEILGGEGLSNAFADLGVPATKTAVSADGYWEVWELPESRFKELCKISDDDWKENWGWWRHAKGSNLGPVERSYIIRGKSLEAWDGRVRQDWYAEYCLPCEDREEFGCGAMDEDICDCYKERTYPDLLNYINNEIGASTEKNVTAICIDLAKQNGMTLAALVSEYM